MTYNPHRHTRHSIRLRGYDYSQPGAYFVTVCSYGRERLFGNIMDGEMILNEFGHVLMESWQWLADQYPFVLLDQSVVMPNHVHGIVILTSFKDIRRGGSRTAPTKPLGRLVGAFKTITAKKINRMRHTPGAHVWQRNYYEHVIRNEGELNSFRQYIFDNPGRWETDEYHPYRLREICAG